jgi:CheY-like chemotaxis protein
VAKILVVDDDQDIRELVGRTVRKQGHQVLTASSGTEALDLVDQRGAPDLVVLDVSMPQMDGLELLGRLRTDVGLVELPAVFLSARVQEADIEAGRALGATYLTKPFVASALRNAIDRLLPEDEDGW